MLRGQLEQELRRWDTYLQTHPDDPQAYVRRGMAHFKLGQVLASVTDFDTAERIDQSWRPQLWQRGISYYYLDQFEAGVHQFEANLAVNGSDIEETLWRFLCQAQLKDIYYAQTDLIPVREDPRMILRVIYDLYSGNTTPKTLQQVAAREGVQAQFYGALYLALFYEAQRAVGLAQQWMKQAVAIQQVGDYMWHVARIHQTLRGWAA